MNWNDDVPSAVMTAQQFKTAFQVTKELHSVPEEQFSAAGIPSGYPVEILGLARDIRRALATGGVEVHFTSRDPSGSRTLHISELPEVHGSGGTSREFPSETAQHWKALIDVTAECLGTDELRFRTGYSKEEVDSASSLLGGLFTD
ncbi:hypothetical protein ACFWBN_18080 [Streptomyces sp. NPDC059989]|uniref:hypothetical protein n=1 Tax=Streptomyces sp. NPDC059989 TaxID=3347026 RepID=UPI003680435F